MQKPNQYGCYEAEITIEFARRGRAYVQASLAECEDRLFRFSLSIHYSYGGMCGPISARAKGYISHQAAKDAALVEAVACLPIARGADPVSVVHELREIREALQACLVQPSLF